MRLNTANPAEPSRERGRHRATGTTAFAGGSQGQSIKNGGQNRPPFSRHDGLESRPGIVPLVGVHRDLLFFCRGMFPAFVPSRFISQRVTDPAAIGDIEAALKHDAFVFIAAVVLFLRGADLDVGPRYHDLGTRKCGFNGSDGGLIAARLGIAGFHLQTVYRSWTLFITLWIYLFK